MKNNVFVAMLGLMKGYKQGANCAIAKVTRLFLQFGPCEWLAPVEQISVSDMCLVKHGA